VVQKIEVFTVESHFNVFQVAEYFFIIKLEKRENEYLKCNRSVCVLRIVLSLVALTVCFQAVT